MAHAEGCDLPRWKAVRAVDVGPPEDFFEISWCRCCAAAGRPCMSVVVASVCDMETMGDSGTGGQGEAGHAGNRPVGDGGVSHGRPAVLSAAEVLTAIDAGLIVIHRSARRKKTISLKREGDRWILAVPQSFHPARHAESIASLIVRAEKRSARRPASDAALLARTNELNRQYFDDGIEPASVVWVQNQNTRFASTTSAHRTIRVSSRLAAVPGWVLDAVLVHELAHLRRPDHSAAFHALTARYPHTKKADVFLEGFTFGERSGG